MVYPKWRRPLACTSLFVFCAVMAWAEPAAKFVPQSLLDRLASGETLRATMVGRTGPLSLAPDHPACRTIANALNLEKPGVVVETLFFWRKPGTLTDERLAAYNALRAIGSLKGIEYYSASRKQMRLFYEESHRVASADSRKPVPDESVATVPAFETLYAFQKDLSFGGNIYRYDFSTGADYIVDEAVNLTDLWYGIVPIAGAGKVRTRLVLILTDDGIVFWVCSSANATVVPGVRDRLQDSFGNRAEAVYRWFVARAQAAWAVAR